MDRWTLGIGALVLLVMGAFLGSLLSRSGASQDNAIAETDRIRLRTEGATELSRQLNVQLVSLLRQTMTDAPVRLGLDQAMAAIEDGLKAVPDGGPAPKEALEKFRRGRDLLSRLRMSHDVALVNLRMLEDEASRLQGTDARALAAALSGQATVLGRVCAEMGAIANKSGDRDGAQSWLALAVRVDPQNAPSHEKTVSGAGRDGGK